MTDYADVFNEVFEHMTRKHDPSKIYESFLDYIMHKNNDSIPFKGEYTKSEMEEFQTLHTVFKKWNEEIIQVHGWSDLCGEIYEDQVIAQSRSKKLGSFYTPRQISKCLSDLVGTPQPLNPTAYDPTCGSSRNLLDYYSRHREVTLVGEDLNFLACKMSAVNYAMNGVHRGYVHHVDTLTREYQGTSYAVIQGVIHETDAAYIQANEALLGAISLLSIPDLERLLLLEELQLKYPEDRDSGALDKYLTDGEVR